ncbi:MAG: biotin--[acetyl-CoA-carboxylase] ligase [Gammaproteobacteria bacterium]|nr:biotin--[acetyl-CoA-carboxylase] ligase [Gammaproteobacteria bacterium]
MSSDDSLNLNLIKSMIKAETEVFIFDELESTNQWLIERLSGGANHPLLCAAESQNSGRGRSGRVWQSPAYCNIYMSFCRQINHQQKNITAISLVMGLAIIRVLKNHGIAEAKLKWPNDILLAGKKLAGVLIEAKKIDGVLYLVVGIGVNVQMPEGFEIDSDLSWSDLSAHGLLPKDRSRMIAMIYNECQLMTELFIDKGFAFFQEEWCSVDEYAGQEVVVMDQDKLVVAGVAAGVDETGCLLVETDTGQTKLVSGDLSLRKRR